MSLNLYFLPPFFLTLCQLLVQIFGWRIFFSYYDIMSFLQPGPVLKQNLTSLCFIYKDNLIDT